MKKIFTLLFSAIAILSVNGQTFTGGSGNIPDNNTQTCFNLAVSGVGVINGTYGLVSVCFNITHTYDADLDIYLIAPDGTQVELTTDNGGSGNNFSGTCFSMSAGTYVTAGSAPFSGTYIPEGNLGMVNNGQNANGTWRLCITDDAGGDTGTLNSWSITFNTNPPTPPPPATNNTPCTAFSLPVGSSCNYVQYSNAGATNSGIANPGCAGYSGGDVWFKCIVPSSGWISWDSNVGSLTDCGMAIYSGPDCNTLTLIECDDIDSPNGSMPSLNESGLTPGETIWVRFWDKNNDQSGTFYICAKSIGGCNGNPAPSDLCATATPICNFNGFCGTTYAPPLYNPDPGHQPDEYGSGSNYFCGSIENNSWLQFIASATDATLNVTVSNCSNNQGIQMGIYSSSDCLDFALKSNCINQSGNNASFTLTGTNLTAGQTYYLMIDGYAGDVCNYTIAAGDGVAIPGAWGDTIISVSGACNGSCANLYAEGGTEYLWYATPPDPTID
ncbi:MAG: proprotein convertase P-domain-containing protein, partial [Bacteroidetes bacterium]|nr:proprotein convertase P-domain-containing protein [Bacteroidota bacterium]